ncbi:MAG: adenylosuccinate lyase [Saprospirales bacterium]|nr:MAG: adenylosuccinate lyase [Saprospirales bacterium]
MGQKSYLTNISPVDGRYAAKTRVLSPYFSEYALIKYRLLVEVRYFQSLFELKLPGLEKIDSGKVEALSSEIESFTEEDAMRIKEIEGVTNHDVKAVEYFLREKFDGMGLSGAKEYIHFGLTSQDINNTAVPLSLKEALNQQILPGLGKILRSLGDLADKWKDVPMLARTHGQPASPTRLGKELRVFCERIEVQVGLLGAIPHTGKFGGATGNFNAHHVTFPDVDWPGFADRFLREKLGLERQQTTTQIEHYDNMAAIFHSFVRIDNILLDLCRDLWTYISMDYFKQKSVATEVGSSAMPHKVNPIDFENAEGNLGVANALFEHLASKLPISRLQRDLTDSTVLRNAGLPFAHLWIALQSIQKGLGKLQLNENKLRRDLEENYMVVAEAIQNILRRQGVEAPYEKLKALTRGKANIGPGEIGEFIDGLEIDPQVKAQLREISPFNYLGI